MFQDEDIIVLPASLLEDLSTDQKHPYKTVKSGCITSEHSALKCRTMDHSRWLATGNRTINLWMNKRDLQGEELDNLKAVVELFVGCYCPMCFQINFHHY